MMTAKLFLRASVFASAGLAAVPAASQEAAQEVDATANKSPPLVNGGERFPQARPDGPPAGPPPGIPFENPVFDDTWATVGIGAGLVPSYSGSDNYRVFPLPLVVGRVAGIGISPNGPGFALNFLSEAPVAGPLSADQKPSFSFGPAFRIRSDRVNQIQDEVVELAEPLDTALEVGASAGVSFPSVLRPRDRVSFNTQVSWDVLGAHNGMLISPSVGYFTPLGRAASLQLSASASFVDDDYADYYYSVTPTQSADTGLVEFTADGGLDSVGLTAIWTLDLDGNALNGGFSLYAITGYSRLVGDAADTPFTSVQGSANQAIAGIGAAYTF
ncbi:MipA/OmpV family protein [uncultured Erythrobacter sp.]|uniref:MipA/OmpV family protein n=1 Tax=uncultured Erythrobacter sp. TaxID=263913 RepID=UPI002627D3F1|nr:MipA/OmpV family protein [uncultured Erythrobacter sp.]